MGIFTELMWSCVCFTLNISGVFPIAVPGERSSLYKTWTFRIGTMLHITKENTAIPVERLGNMTSVKTKDTIENVLRQMLENLMSFMSASVTQTHNVGHFPDFEISFKIIILY